MEKKRFDFPPQGIIARADLVQISCSLTFFELQRRMIQLLDLLPAFRRHFRWPRPSSSPAPAKPSPASNRAGLSREKHLALRQLPRRLTLRKSAVQPLCSYEDRLR